MSRLRSRTASEGRTVSPGRPLVDELDPRTANLLGALVTSLHDAIEDSMQSDLEIAGASAAALITIGNCPGHSVNWLSHVLRLTHSGTVRLLDGLEGLGLTERRPTADARTLALHLTDKGRRRMNELLSRRRACLHAALSGLSGSQQAALCQLLEHMLDNLTVSDQGADSMCRLCDEHVCPQDNCPITVATFRKDLQPS